MLLWRFWTGLVSVAVVGTASASLHFTGNPETDGWVRMGNSQDPGIYFSGTTTAPSFDLYMRTFFFESGWTRAASLIGDHAPDDASWAGWQAGDTVIGLGFVARGGMEIESAWYKIDFNGNGRWPAPGSASIHTGDPPYEGARGFRSTIRGALSVYQHTLDSFIAREHRYTDMELEPDGLGTQVFGGRGGRDILSGFIPHQHALRGWAVQIPIENRTFPLVSSTQFLINYSKLRRLELPLAPVNWYTMKLQLGAYGFGPSGNRNYGQEAMVMPINTPAATPIPEPFTMSLLAGGLALAAIRKRKRKKS